MQMITQTEVYTSGPGSLKTGNWYEPHEYLVS